MSNDYKFMGQATQHSKWANKLTSLGLSENAVAEIIDIKPEVYIAAQLRRKGSTSRPLVDKYLANFGRLVTDTRDAVGKQESVRHYIDLAAITEHDDLEEVLSELSSAEEIASKLATLAVELEQINKRVRGRLLQPGKRPGKYNKHPLWILSGLVACILRRQDRIDTGTKTPTGTYYKVMKALCSEVPNAVPGSLQNLVQEGHTFADQAKAPRHSRNA